MDVIEEYFNVVPIKYSSNDMINNIREFDSTIEIIGYVDELGDIEISGRKKKVFFKFYLNNHDEHHVQVKIWGEEQIKKFMPFIKSNASIHLDGVAAKPCKPIFNKGTTKFELTIQTNTVLNTFGIHDIRNVKTNSLTAIPCKIEDLGKVNGKIKTKGYVKTPIQKVMHDKSGQYLYSCGSITDGSYKVEIRIQSAKEDIPLEKGEKIEVIGTRIGTMNFAASSYLNVVSKNDVMKKEGEKMPLVKLLQGTKNIKREAKKAGPENVNKKMKNY